MQDTQVLDQTLTLMTDNTSRGVFKDQSRKALVWTVIGFALGVALLYAATRKVDFVALESSLKSVEWPWAFGIMAATVIFIASKAARWKMLLRVVPDVRYRALLSAVYVGLATNFLIAHVGEVLRTTIIAKQHDAPFSTVLATVLIERVLDFIALLVLLLAVATLATELPDFITYANDVTGAIVVVAIAGLYLVLHTPNWLKRTTATVLSPLPTRIRQWLEAQLARAREGLSSIRNLRLMTLAIAISVAQWSLVVLCIWFSSAAVGASMSVVAAGVTFILVVVGLTIPNSPLQIGTTQFAFVFGLGMDGIPADIAVAASLVYTAFLILPIMLIGGTILVRRDSAR